MRPIIRHVRYADFISLWSAGVTGLEEFRSSIDVLIREMGSLHAHHVLIDLRQATLPPIPQVLVVEALEHCRRRGLGMLNKVAVVADPGDAARAALLAKGDAAARHLGMQVRGFSDYSEALDWLSDPDG